MKLLKRRAGRFFAPPWTRRLRFLFKRLFIFPALPLRARVDVPKPAVAFHEGFYFLDFLCAASHCVLIGPVNNPAMFVRSHHDDNQRTGLDMAEPYARPFPVAFITLFARVVSQNFAGFIEGIDCPILYADRGWSPRIQTLLDLQRVRHEGK